MLFVYFYEKAVSICFGITFIHCAKKKEQHRTLLQRLSDVAPLSALYGALFKNTDKKKGAPPGRTKKPGGETNISKSGIQSYYYYITLQTICQAPQKKTPDRSRAFPPKGVKQESQAVQGKTAPRLRFAGRHGKKIIGGCLNSYDSKYIIPHIRRNVKR